LEWDEKLKAHSYFPETLHFEKNNPVVLSKPGQNMLGPLKNEIPAQVKEDNN
jgi:hypothetical protein